MSEEIEPPLPLVRRSRVRDLRWFVREITVVAAGILLALAVNGLVEVGKDSRTRNETGRGIIAEMRENRAAVAASLDSLEQSREQIGGMIAATEEGRAITEVASFALVATQSAGWDTAIATQSLSLFPPATVRLWAKVYAGQDILMQSQNRTVDAVQQMTGFDYSGENADRTRETLRGLKVAAGSIDTMMTVERRLIENIDAALAAEPGA